MLLFENSGNKNLIILLISGGPLGNVISMVVAGWISDSPYGWPLVFYLYGSLGVLWGIVWLLVGYDSPNKHPTISLEEKHYIQNGIKINDNKVKMIYQCI